jgi:hypothetical protein
VIAKSVNNLVIVSDTHGGCQFGLCPPDGVPLDGGGRYRPSKSQLLLWEFWQEFWGKFVPEATHREPFDVALDGDIFDYRHHNATSQFTQNVADQLRVGHMIFDPIRSRCRKMFIVRGTEAHTGPSGELEETFARQMQTEQDDSGLYSRFELRLRVGGRGRVNIMHHIGTSGSNNYESTAILKELVEMYVEAGTWGLEPYDAVVRAHRHRYMMITRPSKNGYAYSVVLPGWQLKTPFVARIGMKLSRPQFGGVVFRQGDNDFYHRAYVRSVAPPKEENL